jgi:hemolysin activation/secretion protein
VDISYVLPSHTTASFDSLIAVDPAQREAIEKQFILGSDYTITFSNQRAHRTHTYYASGNVDVAGNLAGLLIGGGSSGTGKQLFGTTFAQYLRLSADVRDYWQLNRKDQWVNRLFFGYGIPYGNSTSLPFVKQFFNGGSNSLRGFRARTLGPGTYDSTENRYLANEAGDIKVEFNSEFRAKLFGIVNGAVFFDAGNIWLKHRDALRPGGEFHFNNFLGQMAADAGAGLRIDASILIVRFDLAFPLREPYLPPGERWVIRDIDFGSSAWRKNNLILNIAIGYPF